MIAHRGLPTLTEQDFAQQMDVVNVSALNDQTNAPNAKVGMFSDITRY